MSNTLQLAAVLTADATDLVAGAQAGAAAIGQVGTAAAAAAPQTAGAAAATDRLAASARQSAAAAKGHADATNNMRQAQVEVQSAIHRTIDSLASGLPLQTILIQQGSELALAYGSAGGFAGVLEALLNPMSIVFLAIGGLSAAMHLLGGAAEATKDPIETSKLAIEELRKSYQDASGDAGKFARSIDQITLSSQQLNLNALIKKQSEALHALQQLYDQTAAELKIAHDAGAPQSLADEANAALGALLQTHDIRAYQQTSNKLSAKDADLATFIDPANVLAAAYAQVTQAVKQTQSSLDGLAHKTAPDTLAAVLALAEKAGKAFGDLNSLIPDARNPLQKLTEAYNDARRQLIVSGNGTKDQLTALNDVYSAGLAKLAEQEQREVQAGQLQIDQIGARTLAERAAVAIAQERLRLSAQQTSAAQAQTLVEQKLAEVIAQATRTSQDNLRDAQDSLALSGVTGYAREVLRIQQDARKLNEQTVIPAGLPAGSPTVAPTAPAYSGPLSAPDLNAVNQAKAAMAGLADLKKDWSEVINWTGDASVGSLPIAAKTAAQGVGVATTAFDTNANAARNAQAIQVRLADAYRQATIPTLTEASRSIDAQRASLQISTSTFGDNTQAVAEATRRQDLLNEFTRASVPITADLSHSIDDLAKRYGSLTAASEDFQAKQRQVITVLDGVRQASTDSLATFTNELLAGTKASVALGDALKSIVSDIVQVEEKNLVESLFGSSGQAGGGALGGSLAKGLGSLFGIGSSAATAQQLSAASGVGGFFAGGMIRGPGTATSDSILARLSDGEFVVRADAAARHRPLLEALNAGRLPAFAAGGPVGRGGGSGGPAAPKVEIHYHGAPDGTRTQETSDGRGNLRLDVYFDRQMAAAIGKPGSATQQALRGATGLTPRIVRR